METNNSNRLPTVQRTITLDGQEYLVRGTANPFDPQRLRIFRAWVRNGMDRGCHTIGSAEQGEGMFGLVGTERDSEQYEYLKGGSQERIAAVRLARARRVQEAQRAILAAFPEISYDAQCSSDEYELYSGIKVIE